MPKHENRKVMRSPSPKRPEHQTKPDVKLTEEQRAELEKKEEKPSAEIKEKRHADKT